MIFLPIVERELRVASRQAWTFWGRALVALGAMVIGGWVMLILSGTGNSGQLARTLFVTLSVLCFTFTLFAGVLFSADSLARERREGTLGLLFLTDLRSVDIALGKLAATSLGSVYCLVSVLPVLAIPLILGGVTLQEYLAMVAVLLVTLWLALSTGLLASTLAQSSGGAGCWAAFLMMAAGGAAPLGHFLANYLFDVSGPPHSLLAMTAWVTPFIGFWEAIESGFGGRFTHYIPSLLSSWLMGLLALCLGTWRLPRLWQDRPRRTSGSAAAEEGPVRRARFMADDPMVWLSNRSRIHRQFPWILLGGVAILWLLLRGFVGSDWNQGPGWIATSLVVHAGLKIWLASEAPRVLHQERASGGIELLLTTGMSDKAILAGRLHAFRLLYFWPLLLVTGVDLLMFAGSLDDLTPATENRILIPAFWLGRVVMLWLDAEALGATGIWLSVATTGQRTTGPTWVRVVLLPFGLWILGLTLLGSAEALHILPAIPFLTRHPTAVYTGVILALNFSVSGFWWRRSTAALRQDFRQRVGQPLGKRTAA